MKRIKSYHISFIFYVPVTFLSHLFTLGAPLPGVCQFFGQLPKTVGHEHAPCAPLAAPRNTVALALTCLPDGTHTGRLFYNHATTAPPRK